MWIDHEYGADDAAYYRLQEARNYFNEDSNRYRRPVVTHVYREAIELYDRHLYEKGACIYHMIRAELGDELFWRAIHTFVQDHAHQTVETIDLLRAIEKATGRNLLFLFDQYVYRGGHPEYKVGYTWDTDHNMAKMTVTQTQVNPKDKDSIKNLFDLKIPIAFGFLRDQQSVEMQSFSVRVHEQEQSFYFSLPEKPLLISFDQGNHTLKQVTLEYPLPELKAQLKYDPDPLSRIDAAQALGKKGGLESVNALGIALTQDPFWGVRVEVAQQLAKIKLDQVLRVLKPGLKDPEARVRRAVVEAMATFKTDESYKAIKPFATKGDPSYYVEAAALQAMGAIAASSLTSKSQQTQVIKLLKSVLNERGGWNEVVRSGAITALSHLKTSETAVDLILAYTKAGIPQPLRLTAIRALGSLSTGQSPAQLERILERLSILVGEPFFLTQVAVSSALGQMETPKAIGLLTNLVNQTPDGRVRRLAEESIKKVQSALESNQALKSLQEELQQLQQTNQDLKSRVEELEAKSRFASKK
jgi:aminopeptidase N